MKLKDVKDIYILVGIFLILSIYDIQWYYNDTLPPTWDDAGHLSSTLGYYNIMTHPNANMVDNLIHVINVDRQYPPFLKLFTAVLYMIFGVSTVVALSTNVVFIGILMFSVYGIGKIFFNSKTGLLAAILVLLYPIIFIIQKSYYLDLGLTAMVTLSIYMLLLTNKFRNFKNSIYFGVVFGLSILTKWTAVIFIMPMFVYSIYDRFISLSSQEKEQNKYFFILSIIVTLIISSIWYIPNSTGLYNMFKKFIFGSAPSAARSVAGSDILAWKSITFYPMAITTITSTFLTIIFLIGLVHIIIDIKNMKRDKDRENKDRIKNAIYLFVWIFIPILIFMFEVIKVSRYILPIVGAIAIISAYMIINIKNDKIRYIVIAVVLIIGTIQIVDIAIQRVPKNEDWKHEIVLREILQDSINTKVYKTVVVLSDHRYMNGKTFGYYRVKNKIPFNIMNGAYIDIRYFKDNLLNFDYIITKTDFPKDYIEVTKSEYNFFNSNIKYFDKMFESELPDNTSIVVYRRNGLMSTTNNTKNNRKDEN